MNLDEPVGSAFGWVILAIYLLPTIVALMRGVKCAGDICVINMLLGWTGVIWVVALLWALIEDSRKGRPNAAAAWAFARVDALTKRVRARRTPDVPSGAGTMPEPLSESELRYRRPPERRRDEEDEG